MRIQFEMGAVGLLEAPENVFRGPVHVVAPRIVRKVIAERILGQLSLEGADIAQEQNDGRVPELGGINHRVEKNQ